MPNALILANARAILDGASGLLATYTNGNGDESTIRVLVMSRRQITAHGWNGEYADVYVHQEDASPAVGDTVSVAGELWTYRPEAGVTVEKRACGGFWVCPCSLGVRGSRA